MVILYASPHEVKYVTYEPKVCIGVGAKNIPHGLEGGAVILFGSCGLVGKHPYNEFIYKDFYCSTHSIKTRRMRESLDTAGYLAVEQESRLVKPYRHVRYIIDRCDRKCMPWGINHFWRIFQHRRMQKKFNEWLKENYEV